MQTIKEAAREIPLLYDVDVVVVGGGPAGIGSAMAAARNGAKTVLVESYGCLGGVQTLTFNNTFSFVDNRIQGGIMREIITNLNEAGASYESTVGCIRDHWGREGSDMGCIYFDGEYYKLLMERMLEEAGVRMLFHAFATEGIVENGELKGIVIASHEGEHAILAKTVIDCTGIAHIAWRSGAEVTGEEGYPDNRFGPFEGQHMGFGYGFFVSGFNYFKFREYAEQNEEEWDYWIKGRKLFAEAKAEGKLYTPRNSVLMNEYPDGRAWILGPYKPIEKGKHPWMIEEVGKAEIDMRKQAWSMFQVFKDNVPGFENSHIEQTPTRLLLRDGHRIVGDYQLVEEDLLRAATFDDAIACCNMPSDVFFPNASHRFVYEITPYDIPYRSITSKTYDNLLAPGASSYTDIVAWSAQRYCTVSITTGQAAGTAAALAAKNNTTVKALDVKLLQDTLKSQGMVTTNKDVAPDVIEQYKLRKKTWNSGLKL